MGNCFGPDKYTRDMERAREQYEARLKDYKQQKAQEDGFNAQRRQKRIEKPSRFRKAKHCNRILPFLFLGDVWDARDKPALQALGINYVLNVTRFPNEHEGVFEYCVIAIDDEDTQPLYLSLHRAFEFLDKVLVACHNKLHPEHALEAKSRADNNGGVYNLFDFWENHKCDDVEHGREFLKTMTEVGQEQSAELTATVDAVTCNVLVHCEYGISRSASVVIAYLMYLRREASVEKTMHCVREQRAVVDPNAGFLKQLREYSADKIKHDEKHAAASARNSISTQL